LPACLDARPQDCARLNKYQFRISETRQHFLLLVGYGRICRQCQSPLSCAKYEVKFNLPAASEPGTARASPITYRTSELVLIANDNTCSWSQRRPLVCVLYLHDLCRSQPRIQLRLLARMSAPSCLSLTFKPNISVRCMQLISLNTNLMSVVQ
jgi:hypothetical protein